MPHSALHPHNVSADASQSFTPPTMLPAVPAALLLDKRLMPLERNAWMVLYASADETGRAVGISYTQLRHFLACVPDIELASRDGGPHNHRAASDQVDSHRGPCTQSADGLFADQSLRGARAAAVHWRRVPA